jgi:hypothetical protein
MRTARQFNRGRDFIRGLLGKSHDASDSFVNSRFEGAARRVTVCGSLQYLDIGRH